MPNHEQPAPSPSPSSAPPALVGKTMMPVLAERGFPVGELRPLASRADGRSGHVSRPRWPVRGGQARGVRGRRHRPLLGRRRGLGGPRAGGRGTRRGGHRQLVAVAHGPPASRWSCPRSTPTTPPLHEGIIANPNCSTMQLVPAAHGAARRGRPGARHRGHLPVRQRHRRRGRRGAARRRSGPTPPGEPMEATVYPHQIAFNALPEIDVFRDDGYSKEEWKVIAESRKILHLPDLRISCTAVRVPVFAGALGGGPRRDARAHRRRTRRASCSRRCPGVVVVDDPAAAPLPAGHRCGRPRRDLRRPRRARTSRMPDGRGLAFWVVSDNLRKGAATNAVQIAELVLDARLARAGLDGVPVGSRDRRRSGATDARGHRRRGPRLSPAAACSRAAREPCRGRGARTPRSCSWARAPGQNEDQQGRPFVGAAGGLLTELIGSIGWRRDEVFITNVVKCRPPGNRDPEPDEIAACAPLPAAPAEVLDPALVVTLGRFSLQTFMPGARIGQAHGTIRPVDPATGAARCARPCAMYHPAAAFRQAALKETMREDMAGASRRAHPLAAAARRASPRRRAQPGPRPVGRCRGSSGGADRAHGRRCAAAGRCPAGADRPSADRSSTPRRRPPTSRPRLPSWPPMTRTRCGSSDHAASLDARRPRSDRVLRIIPLGGVGEIGKNMTVFEYGDEIVVIDCGLMFPDEEMFGIDLVVPDVTYLKERRHKVKAFLITHAHEDHVGGLPYVLPEFPGVPVYASTLARGLLGNKIKEHKLHDNPLLPLEPGETVELGAFSATAFRIGHSIPDAMGIALRTPLGHHRPHRRLQVRPHAGRRQALRLPRAGHARRGGRALPPVRLDAGREPGLHAVRADGRRGLPGHHGGPRRAASSWPPSPATSRASSRSSTPRRRSGARSPSSAARWSRTRASRPTWATCTYDAGPAGAQGPPQGHPRQRARASPRRAPRASRWRAWRAWPTATTGSWRSCPATPSSSAPAPSRATRSTSRAPSTTCSRSAPTSTTTPSSAPTSRATPARKSSS